MKEIGIDVSIQQVPVDVYYADKGTDNWYQADFSIVDYGTRAVPNTYFQLALTSTAPWNYSRWKDPRSTRCRSRSRPSSTRQRGGPYKQAQQILQDQVPMMNFLVNTAVAGQSANVSTASSWRRTTRRSLFREAHFTE